MRKGALLLALVMLATAPTAALAAKKKHKAAAKPKVYDTNAANMNDSSRRLVRAGVWQIFVPAQSVMGKKK